MKIEELDSTLSTLGRRVDDLNLAANALLLSSGVLAVAEIGILAFSDSRRLKIAGAIAPIVTTVLAERADHAHVRYSSLYTSLTHLEQHFTDK